MTEVRATWLKASRNLEQSYRWLYPYPKPSEANVEELRWAAHVRACNRAEAEKRERRRLARRWQRRQDELASLTISRRMEAAKKAELLRERWRAQQTAQSSVNSAEPPWMETWLGPVRASELAEI